MVSFLILLQEFMNKVMYWDKESYEAKIERDGQLIVFFFIVCTHIIMKEVDGTLTCRKTLNLLFSSHDFYVNNEALKRPKCIILSYH